MKPKGDWNLETGTEVNSMKERSLLAWFPLAYPITYTAQVHLPRNGTIHNGLDLPIVLTINKPL